MGETMSRLRIWESKNETSTIPSYPPLTTPSTNHSNMSLPSGASECGPDDFLSSIPLPVQPPPVSPATSAIPSSTTALAVPPSSASRAEAYSPDAPTEEEEDDGHQVAHLTPTKLLWTPVSPRVSANGPTRIVPATKSLWAPLDGIVPLAAPAIAPPTSAWLPVVSGIATESSVALATTTSPVIPAKSRWTTSPERTPEVVAARTPPITTAASVTPTKRSSRWDSSSPSSKKTTPSSGGGSNTTNGIGPISVLGKTQSPGKPTPLVVIARGVRRTAGSGSPQTTVIVTNNMGFRMSYGNANKLGLSPNGAAAIAGTNNRLNAFPSAINCVGSLPVAPPTAIQQSPSSLSTPTPIQHSPSSLSTPTILQSPAAPTVSAPRPAPLQPEISIPTPPQAVIPSASPPAKIPPIVPASPTLISPPAPSLPASSSVQPTLSLPSIVSPSPILSPTISRVVSPPAPIPPVVPSLISTPVLRRSRRSRFSDAVVTVPDSQSSPQPQPSPTISPHHKTLLREVAVSIERMPERRLSQHQPDRSSPGLVVVHEAEQRRVVNGVSAAAAAARVDSPTMALNGLCSRVQLVVSCEKLVDSRTDKQKNSEKLATPLDSLKSPSDKLELQSAKLEVLPNELETHFDKFELPPSGLDTPSNKLKAQLDKLEPLPDKLDSLQSDKLESSPQSGECESSQSDNLESSSKLNKLESFKSNKLESSLTDKLETSTSYEIEASQSDKLDDSQSNKLKSPQSVEREPSHLDNLTSEGDNAVSATIRPLVSGDDESDKSEVAADASITEPHHEPNRISSPAPKATSTNEEPAVSSSQMCAESAQEIPTELDPPTSGSTTKEEDEPPVVPPPPPPKTGRRGGRRGGCAGRVTPDEVVSPSGSLSDSQEDGCGRRRSSRIRSMEARREKVQPAKPSTPRQRKGKGGKTAVAATTPTKDEQSVQDAVVVAATADTAVAVPNDVDSAVVESTPILESAPPTPVVSSSDSQTAPSSLPAVQPPPPPPLPPPQPQQPPLPPVEPSYECEQSVDESCVALETHMIPLPPLPAPPSSSHSSSSNQPRSDSEHSQDQFAVPLARLVTTSPCGSFSAALQADDAANRPEKVKSRWRRSSEMEVMSVVGSGSGGFIPPPCGNSNESIGTPPRGRSPAPSCSASSSPKNQIQQHQQSAPTWSQAPPPPPPSLPDPPPPPSSSSSFSRRSITPPLPLALAGLSIAPSGFFMPGEITEDWSEQDEVVASLAQNPLPLRLRVVQQQHHHSSGSDSDRMDGSPGSRSHRRSQHRAGREERLAKEREAKESKEPKEPRPPYLNYEEISENIYLCDSKRELGRLPCYCVVPEEDDIDLGEPACGSSCINRQLMMECDSRCPTGELCTNRRFQKKEWSKVEPVKTERKGWGLKALEDMPSGTFVLEYVGEVVNNEGFNRRVERYSNESQKHYYFMALKSRQIIDATQKGNMSRFINHSCDPSCVTQKWTVNEELRVGFFTSRDVKAGEELTFDYQFQRYGEEAQKCYCDAPNCRGFIGGDKQTPLRKDKRDIKKKRRRENMEDVDLEEEIEKLSQLSGLKNRHQTLNLCRLMVRVEDTESRMVLLQTLQKTDEPSCLRVFLDYHGLSLMWSWMVDVGPGDEMIPLKKAILTTLARLPITNRTVLADSKVAPLVQKWADQLRQRAAKRPRLDPLPPPPPPPLLSVAAVSSEPSAAQPPSSSTSSSLIFKVEQSSSASSSRRSSIDSQQPHQSTPALPLENKPENDRRKKRRIEGRDEWSRAADEEDWDEEMREEEKLREQLTREAVSDEISRDNNDVKKEAEVEVEMRTNDSWVADDDDDETNTKVREAADNDGSSEAGTPLKDEISSEVECDDELVKDEVKVAAEEENVATRKADSDSVEEKDDDSNAVVEEVKITTEDNLKIDSEVKITSEDDVKVKDEVKVTPDDELKVEDEVKAVIEDEIKIKDEVDTMPKNDADGDMKDQVKVKDEDTAITCGDETVSKTVSSDEAITETGETRSSDASGVSEGAAAAPEIKIEVNEADDVLDTEEIANVANLLLESWSGLKDVYRIPRREQILIKNANDLEAESPIKESSSRGNSVPPFSDGDRRERDRDRDRDPDCRSEERDGGGGGSSSGRHGDRRREHRSHHRSSERSSRGEHRDSERGSSSRDERGRDDRRDRHRGGEHGSERSQDRERERDRDRDRRSSHDHSSSSRDGHRADRSRSRRSRDKSPVGRKEHRSRDPRSSSHRSHQLSPSDEDLIRNPNKSTLLPNPMSKHERRHLFELQVHEEENMRRAQEQQDEYYRHQQEMHHMQEGSGAMIQPPPVDPSTGYYDPNGYHLPPMNQPPPSTAQFYDPATGYPVAMPGPPIPLPGEMQACHDGSMMPAPMMVQHHMMPHPDMPPHQMIGHPEMAPHAHLPHPEMPQHPMMGHPEMTQHAMMGHPDMNQHAIMPHPDMNQHAMMPHPDMSQHPASAMYPDMSQHPGSGPYLDMTQHQMIGGHPDMSQHAATAMYQDMSQQHSEMTHHPMLTHPDMMAQASVDASHPLVVMGAQPGIGTPDVSGPATAMTAGYGAEQSNVESPAPSFAGPLLATPSLATDLAPPAFDPAATQVAGTSTAAMYPVYSQTTSSQLGQTTPQTNYVSTPPGGASIHYVAPPSVPTVFYTTPQGVVVQLPATDQSQWPQIAAAAAGIVSGEAPPPPEVPKPPRPSKLPPNWKTAKDSEGNVYFYHTVTRQTQWEPPDAAAPPAPSTAAASAAASAPAATASDSHDMDLGTPTYDESKSSKKKSSQSGPNPLDDNSSELVRRTKELFRTKMSQFIVHCLNPYRKPDCKLGRISSTEEFKHLARKLTHFVMAKELKHCRNVEDLECNENVKHKSKDFVRKYMAKFGPIYKKTASPKDEDDE